MLWYKNPGTVSDLEDTPTIRTLTLCFVFAVGVAALIGADRYYRADVEQEHAERLAATLAETQGHLVERIDQYIATAEHLRAFLLAGQELPDKAAFDRYCSQVMTGSPELRALQYADAGHVIRYIYPLEGNEPALGLDLMSRPAADVIERAMTTRRTEVGDPVKTVQGSLSVVVRSPMFEQDRYLGLAAVVVDIEPFLEGVFAGLGSGYAVQLQDQAGHVFWGERDLTPNSLGSSILVGGGAWRLVLSRDEVAAPSSRVLGVIWGLGGALLLSAMATTFLLFRRVEDLYSAVKERTAELAESEKRYRSLVETTDDAIVLADLDYRVQYANRAFYRSQGFESAEEADFNAFQRAHPDDRAGILSALQELEKKGTLSTEYRIRHRDGHWVHRQARFNLLRDEEGNPQSILLIAHDITERKLAEQEKLFQARLLDMVEQAVIATKLDGTITYWNKYAETQFGWTAEEALGRNAIMTIASNASRQQAEEILADIGKGGSWSGVFTLRRKDGTTFPAQVTDSPIYDERGERVGIVGISLDISERLQREKELAEAKDLLEATFASLGAAIFVIDPGNRSIVLCNPAVEDVFGFRPEELIGKSTRMLHVDDASYVRFAELSEPVLARQGFFRTDYEMRRRDGDIIHTENTVLSLAKQGAWNSELVVSVVRDISDQKRLQAEWDELQDRYLRAQKMEAVGQLTAGIAHDFNNLLMAITGNAQVIQLSLNADDPLYAPIESILEAGFRAAELIRQLLVFSRRDVVQAKVVNLNAIISKTGEMLQRLIREDIEFRIELEDDLWPVLADPGQLDQVVTNLVVNARDAMPDGGSLVVSTANIVLDRSQVDERLQQKEGEYVVMRVSDSGIGMDEEVQSHMFEPFFTTKGPGQGTGLGLSTVYGIVGQTGGHLRVRSEKGRGSTFEVYLPRCDIESEADQSDSLPSRVPGNLAEGTGTILLVEDERAVRKLARDVLRNQGYTVLEAEDGDHALEILDSHDQRVDLLLTDVVMPGRSGKELANELQQRYPDARVIFMSGYSFDIISTHGLLEPGVNLLPKPFSVYDLVEKVFEVLGDQQDGTARG